MKRLGLILIIVFAVMAAATLYAEEAPKTVKRDFAVKTEGAQSAEGVVREVTPADLTRPNAGLVIADSEGKETVFTVSPGAVVYRGLDGGIFSIKKIVAGDRVTVNYNPLKNGEKRATAVKLILSSEEGPKEGLEAPKEAPQNVGETPKAVEEAPMTVEEAPKAAEEAVESPEEPAKKVEAVK